MGRSAAPPRRIQRRPQLRAGGVDVSSSLLRGAACTDTRRSLSARHRGTTAVSGAGALSGLLPVRAGAEAAPQQQQGRAVSHTPAVSLRCQPLLAGPRGQRTVSVSLALVAAAEPPQSSGSAEPQPRARSCQVATAAQKPWQCSCSRHTAAGPFLALSHSWHSPFGGPLGTGRGWAVTLPAARTKAGLGQEVTLVLAGVLCIQV